MDSRCALRETIKPDFDTVRLVRKLINGLSPLYVPELGWITYHQELSPHDRDRITRYFLRESSVIREFIANQGLFRLPVSIGDNNGAVNWIDRYLLQSPTGCSITNRARAIINVLDKTLYNKTKEKHGIFRIICLGLGVACEIMEITKKIWSPGTVHVSCTGTDIGMLKEYREYAQKTSIPGLSFIAADALSLPYRREYFDIGILAGSLSAMDPNQCVNVLREVKSCLKKGGILLASNVTNKMHDEDPKVCYILDQFAGIKLKHKTPQDLRNIFEEAGYEWDGHICDEPYRFHCMGMGIVR